jgi:pre-mRNA-processing factor 8
VTQFHKYGAYKCWSNLWSAVVFQYYGLVLDSLILGLQRASEMAGPPQMPNNFLQYRDSQLMKLAISSNATFLPIRILPTTLSAITTKMLATRLSDEIDQTCCQFRSCSFLQSLPRSLTTIEWEDTFISVCSQNNPQLLFRRAAVQCLESSSLKDAVWNLTNEQEDCSGFFKSF